MSRMHRFSLSVVLIVGILSVSGLTAFVLFKSKKKQDKKPIHTPPQLVEVLEMTPADQVEWLIGYGTARPEQEATIRAEVSAAVVERVDGLKPGKIVTAGQVLIQLDDRQYHQRLEQAQQLSAADNAELEHLQVQRDNLAKMIVIAKDKLEITTKEYDRVARLLKNKNASDSEYNRNKIELQNARQSLQDLENSLALLDPQELRLKASRDARLRDAEVARLNLERCQVKAPFDGQVDEVFVERGDVVAPGSQLITLVDSSLIEIPVELPASCNNRIDVGAEVVLESDASRGESWTGRVVRKDPTVDATARTFGAYVEVDNGKQEHFLMPGVFVNAKIHGPVLSQVLVLPRTAVKGKSIFVMFDGKATVREVKTGRTLEDKIVILEGLEPGEKVIVTNLDMLYEGADVKI